MRASAGVRLALVLWLVGLVGLTGCARAQPELAPDAAERLQHAVNAVVQAVVEGRYEDAGTAARDVRAALEEAADAGQVSIARYRQIADALWRTETELAALVADPDAEPAEEAAPDSSGPGGSDDGPDGRGPETGEKGPPEHANSGRGRG